MLGCPTMDPATAPPRMLIARMKPAAWVDRVRRVIGGLWQEGSGDSNPPPGISRRGGPREARWRDSSGSKGPLRHASHGSPPPEIRGGISGEFPVKHHPARFRNPRAARAAETTPGERLLQQTAFAPAAFIEAARLIERFGQYAGSEAALRADRSRDLGNLIHFCRWREVGRMIELMRDEGVSGPVH